MIAVSQHRPLVLILDDLHWSDRGMMAMLSHVAHFVPGNPIFLIGAYRDAEVDRKHPLSGALAILSRLRNFESLPLKGLEGKELADLLELVGDQKRRRNWSRRSARLPRAIHSSFARCSCICWKREKSCAMAGAGAPISASPNSGIPEGVRQVIGRRLQRLSDQANQLLSVASAFNGAFDFEIAAAVAATR